MSADLCARCGGTQFSNPEFLLESVCLNCGEFQTSLADALAPISPEAGTPPEPTVEVSVPMGVHVGGWVHCWCGGSHARAWTEYSVREFAPAVPPSDSGTRDLTPDEARRFAKVSRANAVRTRLVEETPPAPPTPRFGPPTLQARLMCYLDEHEGQDAGGDWSFTGLILETVAALDSLSVLQEETSRIIREYLANLDAINADPLFEDDGWQERVNRRTATLAALRSSLRVPTVKASKQGLSEPSQETST